VRRCFFAQGRCFMAITVTLDAAGTVHVIRNEA
jgi:hypothetical protein